MRVIKFVAITLALAGFTHAAHTAMIECNAQVSLHPVSGQPIVVCPGGTCTDPGTSGACGMSQSGVTPGGSRSYKCKCSGGGQAECNSYITYTPGTGVTIDCLNPCAESCDQIEEIPIEETPSSPSSGLTPCFCDN